MENKQVLGIGLWTCAVIAVTVLSTLAIVNTPTCVTEDPLDMPVGQAEFIQKFHDNEKKITVIRAVAANKCLILRNPTGMSTEGLALRVSPKSYNRQLAIHMFGQSNIDNCLTMPIHEVEVIEEGAVRETRQANDTAAPAAQGKHEKAPPAPLAPGVEGTNQCQNQMLVDCGANNAGVYDCVTGPNAIYRANTKCTGASQFVFSLEPRCDEFSDTKGMRFIKCLQHFIFNKHLAKGAAKP